jgi:hypothetical protein
MGKSGKKRFLLLQIRGCTGLKYIPRIWIKDITEAIKVAALEKDLTALHTLKMELQNALGVLDREEVKIRFPHLKKIERPEEESL